MKELKFTLPYPPSVNTYWRHAVTKGPKKHAVTYLSQKGREYRATVACILGNMMDEPIDEPIRLRLDVFLPDRRKRDIDNILKSLLDSMQHAGIYKDDVIITTMVVNKLAIQKPGGVRIVIAWPWHAVGDFPETTMGGEGDDEH